jgi:phosphopantetheinyl transferase
VVTVAWAFLPRPMAAATRARLRAQLPYARRLKVSSAPHRQSQSLLGVALACELLARVTGRTLRPAQLRYTRQGKPYAPGYPDFSISHSGDWVVCALAGTGTIGIDIETTVAGSRPGALAAWTTREAALKAAGARLQELPRARLCGELLQFRGRRWYCRAPRLTPGTMLRVVSSRPITRLTLQRRAAERVAAWQEARR